ncbi:hypothetical protein CHS0354_019326 [Potamilus streckersoni]|uniref:SCP domain-containing protein n=1 Tax=Potamilus streckersoni TaxID=2493646 RepID=A0AAE0SHE7_9BIVA|nr:hypothetical protein CHS0354_019326 [Potamilus streckersoni]
MMEVKSIFPHLICCVAMGTHFTVAVLIDLDPVRVTDLHNDYRRKEPAANMKQMEWNSYLQGRAAEWSENCFWDHQNKGLGENLAYRWTTGQEQPVEEVVRESLKSWYDEKYQWQWSKHCGSACHYTAMVWANTAKVGCALSRCQDLRRKTGRPVNNATYLVCFYNPPGNFIGEYPYINGEKCTKCGKEAVCNNGLCVLGKEPSATNRSDGTASVKGNIPQISEHTEKSMFPDPWKTIKLLHGFGRLNGTILPEHPTMDDTKSQNTNIVILRTSNFNKKSTQIGTTARNETEGNNETPDRKASIIGIDPTYLRKTGSRQVWIRTNITWIHHGKMDSAP